LRGAKRRSNLYEIAASAFGLLAMTRSCHCERKRSNLYEIDAPASGLLAMTHHPHSGILLGNMK